MPFTLPGIICPRAYGSADNRSATSFNMVLSTPASVSSAGLPTSTVLPWTVDAVRTRRSRSVNPTDAIGARIYPFTARFGIAQRAAPLETVTGV